MVCLSDFLATIADCLDVALKENEGEDSVSNLPLWTEERTEVRQDIVHQSIDGSLSIRKGKWKLEMCPGSGGWSYPKPGEEPEGAPHFQLYDLETDIGETQNVIAKYPETAVTLREILTGYIRNGRSTPGTKQKNNGQEVWETILWIDEKQG